MKSRNITLPLDRDVVRELRAGDLCLLSGPVYTLCAAGHARLLSEMKGEGKMPYGLTGQTIFYAGPSPASAGRPFGAIGPMTSSSVDFAAPRLYRAGLAATIGKGYRSKDVVDACRASSSVYFVATGGAGAFLAKHVVSCETVAYGDLGSEALRRIELSDFPVFVGVDTLGECIYDLKA